MKILVTGAAGFIGAALVERLIANGHSVVGIDNMNDYYDVSLKQDRLAEIDSDKFKFIAMDLCERDALNALFKEQQFDAVVNLAAQAGVRYSIENPNAYIDSNLVGFGNILEGCRNHGKPHLVYASSSSVYGKNKHFPFAESDRVDNPVSLYAATKKANELMAHSYADLYGLRCTGLRFFTVYGPWGRPDMAPFLFAARMLRGEPIKVFNEGNMLRDFTYIDDIIEGVVRITESEKAPNDELYSLYNIGRGEPIELMKFIEVLGDNLGVDVKMDMLPMQDGDVPRTGADTSQLQTDYGYAPNVSVEDGVARFAQWYRKYYSL